jgi:hypothetical protein
MAWRRCRGAGALMWAVALALLPHASALVSPVSTPRFVVAVTPEEKAMRGPSPATVAAAKTSLQDLGFVVLRASEGVLDAHLVDSAREEARVDLQSMLSRLRRLGFDTEADSFSFDECVHRSAKRYHLKLERRRLPPSSPWHDISTAAAAWAVPVIEVRASLRERRGAKGLRMLPIRRKTVLHTYCHESTVCRRVAWKGSLQQRWKAS